MESPDGRTTFYLYSQGSFCGYTLYARERGSLVLRAHRSLTVRCDDLAHHPRLVWTDTIGVLGDDGREVVDHPIHLDWSPH